MAKFMLARGKKPCAYAGLKKISRPGNLSDITRKVEFLFYPGKAVDVPGDVDMSAVVAAGHVVQIRDGKKREKKVEAPPAPEKPKPEPKPEMSVATKPIPAGKPDVVAPPTPPSAPEPDAEENGSDYEEMDGGGFKCLHCDKEYKASSRAESYILAHVEKEHL